MGASAGANGVGASASATGVGVGASAGANGVGASAGVGSSATGVGVGVGAAANSTASPAATGAGVAAASVAASPTLGVSVADVQGRLNGREGYLWRALLKKRCPAIVLHAAQYDPDLVDLCRFVVTRSAQRRAKEAHVASAAAMPVRGKFAPDN